MTFTKKLFLDIYWNYIEEPYDTPEEFKQALRTYHKSIGYKGTYPKIKWNEIVIDAPKVVLQYALFPQNDTEDIQEPQVLIEADNGVNFTALELLYKAHNLVGSPFLGDQDNHFFEGFTFATDQDPDYEKGTPVYFLDTGS